MKALDDRDIACIRANNPGPFTLSGTNTYLVGRDRAWCIDPGPAQDAHIDALLVEIERRGELGGIALTHDHADHSAGVEALRSRAGAVPVAGARSADVVLADGDRFGPLTALATPGHAIDHLAFFHEDVCFCGDAILGEGSVFIAPDPGALRGYLAALERLRSRRPQLLCPGHGPLIDQPESVIEAYIAHRLDREARLEAALARGLRAQRDLLDAAWGDVPALLRPAAAVTLAAHLDKLAEENRLPADVERPRWH